MAIRIESSPATPDARRIAALAVSFVAHAGAALLLAIPLAATFAAAPGCAPAARGEATPSHGSNSAARPAAPLCDALTPAASL